MKKKTYRKTLLSLINLLLPISSSLSLSSCKTSQEAVEEEKKEEIKLSDDKKENNDSISPSTDKTNKTEQDSNNNDSVNEGDNTNQNSSENLDKNNENSSSNNEESSEVNDSQSSDNNQPKVFKNIHHNGLKFSTNLHNIDDFNNINNSFLPSQIMDELSKNTNIKFENISYDDTLGNFQANVTKNNDNFQLAITGFKALAQCRVTSIFQLKNNYYYKNKVTPEIVSRYEMNQLLDAIDPFYISNDVNNSSFLLQDLFKDSSRYTINKFKLINENRRYYLDLEITAKAFVLNENQKTEKQVTLYRSNRGFSNNFSLDSFNIQEQLNYLISAATIKKTNNTSLYPSFYAAKFNKELFEPSIFVALPENNNMAGENFNLPIRINPKNIVADDIKGTLKFSIDLRAENDRYSDIYVSSIKEFTIEGFKQLTGNNLDSLNHDFVITNLGIENKSLIRNEIKRLKDKNIDNKNYEIIVDDNPGLDRLIGNIVFLNGNFDDRRENNFIPNNYFEIWFKGQKLGTQDQKYSNQYSALMTERSHNDILIFIERLILKINRITNIRLDNNKLKADFNATLSLYLSGDNIVNFNYNLQDITWDLTKKSNS
ncbi:hypothetical protein LNO75_00480 [Mycoplasma sp. T363T]|uniref:hypothetical protein n=1 Tax=Mycoplasma bradburyae TaxID=2963128 RepID=UPI0023409D2E|nr:hypothetical protein [Mycoplasma bradburyae]MDC4163057.1 hypothetical protein [Mycoplasma bradburyae]